MAKNEIPKISDFQYLGLCDGFAMVYLEDNTHRYEVGGDFNVHHITKHGRRRNHPDKTRNLQCNFCGYSTQKMSNTNVDVKKVHKRIERGPEDQGFTILFI